MNSLEQLADELIDSRGTRQRTPPRYPFFHTLQVAESHVVECMPTEHRKVQTLLCVVKRWHEQRLGAKFHTQRVANGVRVERVA